MRVPTRGEGGAKMRRRDFLIGGGALTLAAAGGPLLFRGGRAIAGSSPIEGLIPFNDRDTLENIRAIIRHNGFRFEVDHTWCYHQYGYAATSADAKPLDPRSAPEQIIIPPAPAPADPELPSRFDLRDINGRSFIGPVRDQGCTGLCPLFATTAAAESAYNRRNNLYDDNSVLVSPLYMKHVANAGATEDLSALYSMTRSGIPWLEPGGLEGSCSEENFPFASYDDHAGSGQSPPAIQIKAATAAPRITLRRCALIHPYNYWETTNRIKRAIYKYGAVTAGIENNSAFRAYKSGIYEDIWIYPNKLPYYRGTTGHAIALVGWDDNPPEGGNGGCWILRNSWGPTWGEGGYMRIRYFSSRVNCATAFLEAESPDDGTLRIYGKVTVDGGGASEATVTLSGDDSFAVVAMDGTYGIPTLRPGSYRVTPDQPGVVFTPPYQDVNLTTGYAVVNFEGKSAIAG